MIKAVIFDFGNVISYTQDKEIFKLMSEKTGISEECLSLANEIRGPFDRGDIDSVELYRRVLKQGGYEEEAEDVKLCHLLGEMDLESWSYLNPETCDWAKELKEAGYKIGVLSNMPFEFLAKYEDENPVFEIADSKVFSCYAGVIKPDRRIYEIALEHLGIEPEEAVFFDDIERNVNAAKEVGINAFVFTGVEEAKKIMEELS